MEGAAFLSVLAMSSIALYFMPALIAWHRHHPRLMPIMVLNFIGGWTVVGWVVAIVWAVTSPESQATARVEGPFCSQCGSPAGAGAVFCRMCGARI